MVLSVTLNITKQKEDPEGRLQIEVEASGKYKRKATWDDLSALCSSSTQETETTTGQAVIVNSDLVRDWIDNYQQQNFEEMYQADEPGRRPYKCLIHDEPENGHNLFKDYDWNPVKLELKEKASEIKKQTTTRVSLTPTTFTSLKELEEFVENTDNGDNGNGNENVNLPTVTSTIARSKLMGHALAVELLKTNSEISTEFYGFDTTNDNAAADDDDDDGERFISESNNNSELKEEDDSSAAADIWKSTKPLKELLLSKEAGCYQHCPCLTGNKNKQEQHNDTNKKKVGVMDVVGMTYEIVGYETSVKVRVYYKAVFTGEVSTDHRLPFQGKRYHNFPLKYLLQYNNIPKQVLVYEDIDFKFYTGIKVASIPPKPIVLTIQQLHDYEGNEVEESFVLKVEPSDTVESIQTLLETKTNIEVKRQVLKFADSMKESQLSSSNMNIFKMGMKNGDVLVLEIYKIPITILVKQAGEDDDTPFPLWVEPCYETINDIKQMIESQTDIKSKRQLVSYQGALLHQTQHESTIFDIGMHANDILTVEIEIDPIIFIDIKCGTLFAVDRNEVIQKKILTPCISNHDHDHDHNDDDDQPPTKFKETNNNDDDDDEQLVRDQMCVTMMNCVALGVNPHKIVEKTEIENHGVEHAESVKEIWNISLKKLDQNKKGEEVYVVDPLSGEVGELLRTECLRQQFMTDSINPYSTATNASFLLEEAETDAVKYDKYIMAIRKAFGIGDGMQ